MIGKFFLLTTLALAQGMAVGPPGGFVASDRCLAAGHQLLPHEYDCTKFYSCDNGRKWEPPWICSPGTEFSYELQICIHPNLANCNLPGAPPPDAEEQAGEPQIPVPIVRTKRQCAPGTSDSAVLVCTWPQSTGHNSSGHKNSENGNTGTNHSLHKNIGQGNTGVNNIGNDNSGNNNVGNNNTGNNNVGNGNGGSHNLGNDNTGDYNTGNNNSGNHNTGNNNAGDNHTGDNH